MSIDCRWPLKPGKTVTKKIRRKKDADKKLKMELNKKTETTPADQSANRRSLPYHIGEETTMTEKREIGLENPTTDSADTGGWSLLTFTCPKCGSHKLIKYLGGQLVYGQVDEIHYKLEEEVWEDSEEDIEEEGIEEEDNEEECDEQDTNAYDDVEDAYVLVKSKPDGTEIWNYASADASDNDCWFQCGECDYELPVEGDIELAKWLIQLRREPSENGNTSKSSS
jgi:hypothetical protein